MTLSGKLLIEEQTAERTFVAQGSLGGCSLSTISSFMIIISWEVFYHRLSSVCREVHFQLKQTRKPRDAIGTDPKSNLKKKFKARPPLTHIIVRQHLNEANHLPNNLYLHCTIISTVIPAMVQRLCFPINIQYSVNQRCQRLKHQWERLPKTHKIGFTFQVLHIYGRVA